MPTLSRRPIIDEAVVWADMDNEAVLLNVRSGIYFGLNEVGTAIWRWLVEDSDEEEIVLRLQEDFEVDSESLRHDVAEFFHVLEERGLISFTEARGGTSAPMPSAMVNA